MQDQISQHFGTRESFPLIINSGFHVAIDCRTFENDGTYPI